MKLYYGKASIQGDLLSDMLLWNSATYVKPIAVRPSHRLMKSQFQGIENPP